MDILQWMQLSEIKTGILDVAQALTDEYVDRGQQSAQLVELSKKIHHLEGVCIFAAGK